MNVREVTPKRLLNPAGGFLSGYSHTLNPYAGCAFSCSYCYVRRMPVALFRSEAWGSWVDVKADAAAKLRKELKSARRKGTVSIFMSSGTDPYQPVEAKARVTRSMLEAMAEEPPDFLLVQTRSPLVVRDVDMLQRLGGRVRISVTVETDLEAMRRAFTPAAPPIAGRLRAMKTLREAGLQVQAAVSPVLPCSDAFADKLSGCADRVVVDDYFMGDGSQGKRTESLRIRAIYERLGMTEWYRPDAYLRVMEQLERVFGPDRVYVSRDGFLP